MRTLNYFLADSSKYKARVSQLGFIREFLQSNFKHRFLRSWTVDMENNSNIMPNILEDR